MTFILKHPEFIGTINPVRFGVSPMNPRMENIGTYRLTLIWIVNIPFVMPRKNNNMFPLSEGYRSYIPPLTRSPFHESFTKSHSLPVIFDELQIFLI
jgi:hypothetical protein